MYHFLAILLLFAGLISEPALATDHAVPVYQEPRHRLVFENDQARILDVQIAPGDTTLYHIHAQPILYVSLGWQPSAQQVYGQNWGEVGEAQEVGKVSSITEYAVTPRTHRVTNKGDSLSRIIAVTNGGPGNHAAPDDPAEPGDQAEVDNPWFRSHRFILNPGESTPNHQHASPVVVVQVSPGGYELVEYEKTTDTGDALGSWSWLDAETGHNLHNPGDSKIELIEIEVR